MQKKSFLTFLFLIFLAMGAFSISQAETFEIYPSPSTNCNEEFQSTANRLKPGDELILHGGIYSHPCPRAIMVKGTASNPIIIRAADGEIPVLTRPGGSNSNYSHGNIEIIHSSYLIIRGIHFKGGSTGVRFFGGHHIVFEENEVSETGNNAITLNNGDTDSFILRKNHIHHTGLLRSSSKTTEGEGMYVGCNYGNCIASNHIIENNYVHHLRGTNEGGNDGIEVKAGSFGNIIRNNVIHDTNIGTQYPCIFVYGGGRGLNVVEGNVVWNCGEGIQVVSDAIIRNNIVLNSSMTGITATPHLQIEEMRNVTIVNNTIYGHPECLQIGWAEAKNMVLANNALFCPGKTAINNSGLSGAGIKVSSNYLEGEIKGEGALDNVHFFHGGAASTAFSNPENIDFWPAPGSILRGRADSFYAPERDFNETARLSPHDVGAYETEGRLFNPGCKITPGFKPMKGSDKDKKPAP